MSHFTVVVAVPGDVPAYKIDAQLDHILAPYDEGTSVPRYLSKTRQQIIDGERKELKDYAEKGYYAKYLSDPEEYISSTSNVGHLKYLGVPEVKLERVRERLRGSDNFLDKLTMDREKKEDEFVYRTPEEAERKELLDTTFPERLARIDDDDFVYKLGSLWYEGEDLDEEGNAYSTYNPQSEWDWWVVGGRWAGYFNATNEGEVEDKFYGGTYTNYSHDGLDRVRVSELNSDIRTPYAFVDLDGAWKQKGKMGWFGMSNDEMTQEEWDEAYRNELDALPKDTWLIMVDCHI